MSKDLNTKNTFKEKLENYLIIFFFLIGSLSYTLEIIQTIKELLK